MGRRDISRLLGGNRPLLRLHPRCLHLWWRGGVALDPRAPHGHGEAAVGHIPLRRRITCHAVGSTEGSGSGQVIAHGRRRVGATYRRAAARMEGQALRAAHSGHSAGDGQVALGEHVEVPASDDRGLSADWPGRESRLQSRMLEVGRAGGGRLGLGDRY